MPIETVLLPTWTPSGTRNTPRFILQRMFHLVIDRVVVVLTVISVTAGRCEMFSVAQFAKLYAVVEAVEFGLWWLLETFIDALAETVDGDAAFGVAGGGA